MTAATGATSSSSAAARPAWPSATSSPSRAGASRSWKRPTRRRRRGASAGTRCGCSPRSATTACPGRAFPGDPDSYPGRDDVVAYLTDYARDFELPVELNSRVRAVRQAPTRLPGRARRPQLRRRAGRDRHRPVPGPARAGDRRAPGPRTSSQFHSSEYRGPQDVPAGPVLVVGGGNTGYQIAEELARTHEVHLSIGARQTPLPQRILGRDLFRYLEATRPDGQDRGVADRPTPATTARR